MVWRFVADLVVAVHLAFIGFVVFGGALVVRWRRLAVVHLTAAAYGVVIQVAGFTCPLTPLEKWLRRRAGDAGYDGGFVERYLIPIVYPGEFTTAVKLVVALVIIAVNVAVYTFVFWRGPRARGAQTER